MTIRHIQAVMREPMVINDDISFVLGLSVGAAVYPDDGTTFDASGPSCRRSHVRGEEAADQPLVLTSRNRVRLGTRRRIGWRFVGVAGTESLVTRSWASTTRVLP